MSAVAVTSGCLWNPRTPVSSIVAWSVCLCLKVVWRGKKEGPRALSSLNVCSLPHLPTSTLVTPTQRVPTWTVGKHAGNRGSTYQQMHLSATACEDVRTMRSACNIRSWTPEIALKPPITQCTRPSAVCGGSDCLCDSRAGERQAEAIVPNLLITQAKQYIFPG
jgi:hypothetical protein